MKYIYTQGTQHDFAPNTVLYVYIISVFKANIYLGLHTSKLALVIGVSPSDDIVNSRTYSILYCMVLLRMSWALLVRVYVYALLMSACISSGAETLYNSVLVPGPSSLTCVGVRCDFKSCSSQLPCLNGSDPGFQRGVGGLEVSIEDDKGSSQQESHS